LFSLAGVGALGSCPKVPDRNPQVVFESDSPISRAIPFARLLAQPEKYDGERVLLFGVFGVEKGGPSFYLDADSMQYSVQLNGILLQTNAQQELIVCRLFGRWGLVQGTFRMIRGDVAPGFVGRLENVSRIRPVSRRGEDQ
jgi:hypothetical protein